MDNCLISSVGSCPRLLCVFTSASARLMFHWNRPSHLSWVNITGNDTVIGIGMGATTRGEQYTGKLEETLHVGTICGTAMIDLVMDWVINSSELNLHTLSMVSCRWLLKLYLDSVTGISSHTTPSVSKPTNGDDSAIF